MLLEHNKNVYEQMTATLVEHNCCCVVMGTGVGKTYVTTEYLDMNDLRALVVSPRNSINKSWEKHTKRVETVTYQKLANIYKDIDYSHYDIVVCDEVHHIGAPKWGKSIKYLIDNKIIPVIGLTEDSVRYTDGGRNVADEFFYGNIAKGEDVPTAIEKGILNSVTYVGAMYNSDGLKKTLRGKIQSRLYAKLNLVLNKTPTVEEIIKKNMPEGNRKGIIFASTIDDIKFAIDFMKSIYPDVNIRTVHSKQSDVINERNIKWFKKAKEGYLCSVDMLSEGVHIKGVNTLVMLRRTESVNLFNQQLGRCLDASSKQPAILFDLVNNQYSIHLVKNKVRIKVNTIKQSSRFNIVASDQLIIRDYTEDIVKVLKEIRQSLLVKDNNPWTEEEKEILAKYWSTEHKDVISRLPRHTADACRNMAATLGLVDKDRFWSEDDIKFLTDNYSKMSIRDIAYHLSRSVFSVSVYANKLGLHKKADNWSDFETDFLKENYAKIGPTKIYEIFKKQGIERSKKTIAVKARSLGLSFDNTDREWSEEENKVIRKYYPNGGVNAVIDKVKISHQNKKSISRQAQKLGIAFKNLPSVWSEEEIDIIRQYYPTEGPKCVSRLPGRTTEGVIYIAKKNKIRSLRKKEK